MNNPLGICLGSMTFVLVVTLIVTARIARRTFALQKIARLQEQRRKQAEADSAAAWAARKPIKPSGPYYGYASYEAQQEALRRRDAEWLLSCKPKAIQRIREWSESNCEIMDAQGNAIVSLGRDGKLYNMHELATHMGKIFRSSGDLRFNMMMADVYVKFHTYPSNLIPISLSDAEKAEISEYEATGRGLALQYPDYHPGGNHQAVNFQSDPNYSNGLPVR